MVYCPSCGVELDDKVNYCMSCGRKIDAKNDGINKSRLNVEEAVELESAMTVPKGLALVPGEKLLAKHKHFFASNKRIIFFKKEAVSTGFNDLSYRHIKGIREDSKRPYLGIGLILGLPLLLYGLVSMLDDLLVGFASMAVGLFFLYSVIKIQEINLFVIGVDGSMLIIPKINSDSGRAIGQIIRTQLYGR